LAFKNLLDDEAYEGFYKCRAFDGLVVKCSCLNPAGWICMIGDASHAVMPATGEGINSGLEDAAVLGTAAKNNPEDPFAAFDAQHRANAHALQVIALQSKEKVVASPKQRATNLMVTIGLGIAKKLHIIKGTSSDFMLGEMAKTQGVKSYAELVEMEARQTRGLRQFASGVTKVFRVSDENPLDVATKKEESSTDQKHEQNSSDQLPSKTVGA
jgi:kynurenine 3-monooxygenase